MFKVVQLYGGEKLISRGLIVYIWALIKYVIGIFVKLLTFPFTLLNMAMRRHRRPQDKALPVRVCNYTPETEKPVERHRELEIVQDEIQQELFKEGELNQRLQDARWERERFEYFKAWEMGAGGELIAFDYSFEPVKTVLLKVWVNDEYQKDKNGNHKVYKAVVKSRPGKFTTANPTGRPEEYFRIKGVEFKL